MKAKRNKRYRKIMDSYSMAFAFHEPYQVLLDAAFLRACHAFHMDLKKFLEITLQGQCKMMVSQCTLAKITKDHADGGQKTQRPEWLPPPTEVPARYCKHDDKIVGQGWNEADCLVDLVGGLPQGNEVPKNKWHYILATADPSEKEMRSRKYVDVRQKARMVPGVPIVYVKRSVMVLEELSGASLRFRQGQEKEKFREGLVGGRKRKRGEGEDNEESDDEQLDDPLNVERDGDAPRRGMKKARGPNPLSVRKKKAKDPQLAPVNGRKDTGGDKREGAKGGSGTTKKRWRKHGGQKGDDPAVDEGRRSDAENIIAAHSRLQDTPA